MNSEDWKRLDSVLARAVEIPVPKREAWLRATCGDNSELLQLAIAGLREEALESPFLKAPSLSSILGPSGDSQLTGRRLGDFELRECIGAGGMGVVYRAVQLTLDREAAVKVLSWTTFDDPSRRARFVREARTIARLDHPGIVRIFTAAEEQGIGYLAMELLPGPQLAEEIERLSRKDASPGPLPAFDSPNFMRVVARLAAQAAGALDCAHTHGVVHRDVKPANMIFDGSGSLKLVDFGLARDRTAAALSQSGDALGTPAYMSPEQVRAKTSELDARTDIYSLGVVMFEMLTLRRPFEGDLPELLVAIVRGSLFPPSNFNRRVPRDLDLICQTAMARDPNRRYPSAGALHEDLERFLRGEALSIGPPSLVRKVGDFLHRRRILVGAAISLCLAVWLGVKGAELRAGISHRAALPDVLIRLETATFDAFRNAPSGLRVQRWPVDPLSGAMGAPIDVGQITGPELQDFHVPSGNWRYVVTVPSLASGEFTRYVDVGDDCAQERVVNVLLRPDTAVHKGMVRVEGVHFHFDDARILGCTSHGAECDIPPFWIDLCEVSNGDYIRFLEATGHALPKRWRNLGCTSDWHQLRLGERESLWLRLPIAGLSWLDARDYAEWCGKRLPTHAELEYVLRGARLAQSLSDFEPIDGIEGLSQTHVIPGPPPRDPVEFFAEYLNSVVPVDDPRFRQPPLGLFHVFGNVGEFTESLFADGVAPAFTLQSSKRIYLGGSWDSEYYHQGLDTHAGTGINDSYIKDYVGVRCVKSCDP